MKELFVQPPTSVIREFVEYLRQCGYVIGLSELKLMVQISELIGLEDFRSTKKYWRAIVSSDKKQWLDFPKFFETFFFPQKVKGSTKTVGIKRQGKNILELVQEIQGDSKNSNESSSSTLGLASHDGGDGLASNQAQGGASRTEALVKNPLQDWLPKDSAQLDAYLERMQRHLQHRLKTHFLRSHLMQKIDLPKSIQHGIATNGEVICLHYRKRDTKTPSIFVLVDVSKSMESHAQFFLRIARSFVQVLNARVFVFHTAITEVTDLMTRDSARIQEKINAVTFGFGSGTSIGTNLEKFIEIVQKKSFQSSRGIHQKDIVYVLSDGYDTDPPELMLKNIQKIRRYGASVYWLHPTKKIPQSEAIKMSKAYINDFLAIDQLGSLNHIVELSPNGFLKNSKNKLKVELWDVY